MGNILIIDDEASIRRSLREVLEYEGFQIDEAQDGKAGLEAIKKNEYDLVFCDIKMPRMDGMEVLEKVGEIAPDTQIVMITGHGNEETAFEAAKKGAFDFIQKPIDLNRVLITVRNAIDRSQLVTETKVLKRRVSNTREIIGESPAILKIKDTIERVASTSARVLISGENGTGKELVARWIHEKSNRANSPLVEVNCAAIPSELIESELFGHEKGAFTSAINQRIGKFEQANGGTLFLDEIGDMSLSAQAKVLRVLEDGKVTRVGGEKEIAVDVRVIAATNKDLVKEIDRGNFRLDLYHRLGVILMHVPSLNERAEDIPLIAKRFLIDTCQDYSIAEKKFTPKAMKELQNIEWTGNIRELRNVVERLIILCGDTISENDVLTFARPANARANKSYDNLESLYDEFNRFHDFKEFIEKDFIEFKLRKNTWNVSKTAEELDIQRSHLYNKIDKFKLVRT